MALHWCFLLCSPLSFRHGNSRLHLGSIIEGKYKTPEAQAWLESSRKLYGENFRTFKHGALHGTIAGIFFALPVFGIIALFERRSWKYVLIHLGFWVITLALMGGVLCQWA